MDRRSFIAVAGATTLAGCGRTVVDSSGDATTTEQIETADEGPPNFERVEIDGPDEVTVEEEFSVTLSAANTGGRKGDFTATLSLKRRTGDVETEIDIDESVRIEDIEKGTRVSTEISPIHFSIAGDYTFHLADHDTSHTVSVAPRKLEFGNTVAVTDEIRLAPQKLEVRTLPFYHEWDSEYLIEPDDGNVFAIVHVTVKNTTSDSIYLSPEGLSISPGRTRPELSVSSNKLSHFRNIEGEAYQGNIDGGETSHRWLLVEVGRPDVTGTIEFGAQRDVRLTPPEIVWTDEPASGTRQLPKFELASFDLPDSSDVGTEFPIAVTIENAGDATGTFRGAIYQRNSTRNGSRKHFEWIHLPSIEPGSSKTFETTMSIPFINELIYGIEPFDAEERIEFSSANRRFGESYTTPEGIKSVLDDLAMSDTIRLSSGNEIDAPAGNTFVLASIDLKNQAETYEEPPQASEFELRTGGERHSVRDADSAFETIESPVEGPYYTSPAGLSGDDSESGVLTFEIPDNVDPSAVSIRWKREYSSGEPTYEAVVNWSVDG
jgi:hypothetical protein